MSAVRAAIRSTRSPEPPHDQQQHEDVRGRDLASKERGFHNGTALTTSMPTPGRSGPAAAATTAWTAAAGPGDLRRRCCRIRNSPQGWAAV